MNRFDKFELAVAMNETDHVLGRVHAPATLVEYGDFECPNSEQAAPVHSTPTFFINGLLCDVSYGLQPLKRGIEAALSA